ncbi:MAG: hypothetical protein HYV09_19490 [Deltaproteobacteria bacterium]|nr:hypothetical protein [Deltaproteobacteria bacterium]
MAALFTTLVFACGGKTDDGPRGLSGVPVARLAHEMTAEERALWCDWLFGPSGVTDERYDVDYYCHGYAWGSFTREECIAYKPPAPKAGCERTVGQEEACALAVRTRCPPFDGWPVECSKAEECRG